jgi:hypothetical protein
MLKSITESITGADDVHISMIRARGEVVRDLNVKPFRVFRVFIALKPLDEYYGPLPVTKVK